MMRSMFGVIALTLASCTGDAGSGTLATRADSAGVEVITNTGPAWGEGAAWQIDAEPLLQIGHREDADPHYNLLGVRSALLLPDGGILVIVGGANEVRRFDAAGTWVQTMGRGGEGPGEFRRAQGLWVAGDTTFVADVQLNRVTGFGPDGAVVGTWPFPTLASGQGVTPLARTTNGEWLGSVRALPNPGELPTSGAVRFPMIWYRVAPGLASVSDSLAALPGQEQLINISTDAAGQIAEMRIMSLPISRASFGTSDGRSLLVGDNAAPELRRYDPVSGLQSIIRWTPPAVPIDAALLDRMKEAELREWEGNTAAQEGVARTYEEAPATGTVPYFGSVMMDTEGALWVEDYPLFPRDSIRYQVLQPGGQLLGRITLPPRHSVRHITRDRILAVWRDDDDLEYLRVYRLGR